MRNKKKKTRLILLTLLVCITLGYAALRTGLNINGTTNVSSASWDVHFENYQKSASTNITPTTEPVIIGTTTTTITYEVDLVQPGDLYEFTVDGVNAGSLDAMVESVSSKLNDVEIDNEHPVPVYLDYSVTYEDGEEIAVNHLLPHNSSETYKVRVKYKDDIDPSLLPETSATLSFELTITYIQASDSAFQPNVLFSRIGGYEVGEVLATANSNPLTTYVSRGAYYQDQYNTGYPFYTRFALNSAQKWCIIDTDTNYNSCSSTMEYPKTYDSQEKCESALENDHAHRNSGECVEQTHVVVDKSYLQIDFSNKNRKILKQVYLEDCHKPNPNDYDMDDEYFATEYQEKLTEYNECVEYFDNSIGHGIYELQIGIDESSSANKPVFNSNKTKLLEAFGSNNCTTTSSSVHCAFNEDYYSLRLYSSINDSGIGDASGYGYCNVYDIGERYTIGCGN